MGIFDIFHRNKLNKSGHNKPEIKFGFGGEDVIYSQPDKEIYISYTWINGARIHSESINKWKDGSILTQEERQTVFNDILRFLRREGKKPIIVINTDDASKELWARLCNTSQKAIKGIEYTSEEEKDQFHRQMCLDIFKSGGNLEINGAKINNEQELDEALRKLRE